MKTTILLIVIVLIIVVAIIARKVYTTERKKSDFMDVVKPGDKCRISVPSTNNLLNDCEIKEVFEKDVIIQLRISKRWIYPQDEKK